MSTEDITTNNYHTKEKILELKSISELFKYNFLIPSYQRGYRWDTKQVTQLLDDIWQFANNQPNTGGTAPFYCLQPLIVKKRVDREKSNNTYYEVIDGQQRLTTIYLILKNLEAQIERDDKNIARIFYETRNDSEDFLKKTEEDKAKKNVDYYHIYEAEKAIYGWFQKIANETDEPSPRASFAPTFLKKTKVIWYEITDESVDAIEVFTRVNIGKIPLTNSELIKALFLQQANFEDDRASLKQIQIASEWDQIEKSLQEDPFWYFLYNPDSMVPYENRIEFILDLKTGKKKGHDFYATFFAFQQRVKDAKKIEKYQGEAIDEIWLSIKQYFLRLEEWYCDHELYHLIGFLISVGYPVDTLITASSDVTKTDYRKHLTNLIRAKVKCDIDKLSYGNKLTKQILLLFNVNTIIATENHEVRFPFNKYKLGSWDIEHVRSKTDKQIVAGKRKEWAEDVLEYFMGDRVDAPENDMIINNYCNALSEIVKAEKINDDKFNRLYEQIIEYFHENNNIDDIDNISNLALLDSATNRSYKNAMFPIKRKRIIENDKSGQFIPICTKNLFLKYYTKQMGNVMYWQENDALDYLTIMKESLKTYLPNQ